MTDTEITTLARETAARCMARLEFIRFMRQPALRPLVHLLKEMRDAGENWQGIIEIEMPTGAQDGYLWMRDICDAQNAWYVSLFETRFYGVPDGGVSYMTGLR